MLEYVSGLIASLAPTFAVIDCGGLGYNVNITLPSYTALQGKPTAKLLLHEVIREDQWLLFGFIEESERELFRQLIGVSGVGANTARMILSSLSVAQLQTVILSGDVKQLKAVKGIGAKTAERIIVDLKDKIKPESETLLLQPEANNDAYDEALAALLMLGFPKPQSVKVLRKLFEADPAIKVEAAIKRALTMM
ncbi:MAG: Holliday junction branch migration protein RuvA [Muribaculaceae bacterium]|nr:Holliday junction branch migration protein RuvA [Muribaculaceae bacterium]